MLKHLAIFGTVLTLIASSASGQESGPTEPAYLYRANVVNIIDGDTIDVDIDLGFYVLFRDQRIRLLGIDAPEPKGETKAAGDAATAYLAEAIKGKSIILRSVRGKDGADRKGSFGRWLGTIYLDGVDINQQMIEAGHAVAFQE